MSSRIVSWLYLGFAIIFLVTGVWMGTSVYVPVEAIILMVTTAGIFLALHRAEEAMIRPNFEIQVDSEAVQHFLDENFREVNMVSSEEKANELLDEGWVLMGYDDLQKTLVLGKTKDRIKNEEALNVVNDYVVNEDEKEG